MGAAQEFGYKLIGLAYRQQLDRSGSQQIPVRLFRCPRCFATVDEDDETSALRAHIEWHDRQS